jgi:hypothetical protein
MSSARILFLDIDGVVLPDRARWLPTQTKPVMKVFDPCAVGLLNQACHKRRFKIVIHSSWLRYWDKDRDGRPTVTDWCIFQGIKKGHFHTDSECNGSISWRYDRIDEWLARHPDVNRFVILDDDKPQDGWAHTHHLFQTNENEGITMEIYRKLLTNPLK